MSDKKKSRSQQQQRQKPAATAAPADRRETKANGTAPPLVDFGAMLRHPTFVAACFSLLVTLFAAAAAIRYRNDWNMGVIGEPTGVILWGAITFTLFISYRRELKGDKPKSSS